MKKSFTGQNRVAMYRRMMHYTQKDAAYLLGVPRETLSRWEHGLNTPSVYHAIGISVAFRHLVDVIFVDYRNDWIATIGQRAKVLEQMKGRKKSNGNDKR